MDVILHTRIIYADDYYIRNCVDFLIQCREIQIDLSTYRQSANFIANFYMPE